MKTIFHSRNEQFSERGVGALLVVVVLGGVLLLSVAAAARSGIGQLTRHLGSVGVMQVRAVANGCLEDQLRTFVYVPSDVGDALSVTGGTCIITVTGGGTKDILVVANTTDGYATALRVFATVSGSVPASINILRSTFIPVP